MSKRLYHWRPALLVLLSMSASLAQSTASSSKGFLTGSALDSEQHPIPAVKVYLQRLDNQEISTAVTDASGAYRFKMPGGSYTLRAESAEKGQASIQSVTIRPSETTTINLTLRLSTAPEPQFFDEPQFTVAGITDNTYRGGHGSDTVLRSAEKLAKATASLNNAPSDPDSADPHHALAENDERSGHPLQAVQEFQRAAELNPTEANLFSWGTELLAHRAPQAASEVFAKGVRLFPQSTRLLLGLGSSQYATGMYAQAAQSFFNASDLNPNDPTPYLFLSEAKSREITDASGYQERLARFTQLQPDNALAAYRYAVSLLSSQRVASARSLLEKAITLDPSLGPAYLELGIVDASERKYPGAIRAFQKAIEIDPKLEEAHYRLAEAYTSSSDQIKAKQELAIYRQLSKQSAETLERERRDVQQFVIALRKQSPASK